MGGNVYGVEAAARTYFGSRPAISISRRPRCWPRFPTTPRTSRRQRLGVARARQRFVLNRMVSLGEISRPDAELAYRETLHARIRETGIAGAPHALFFLASAGGAAGGRVRTTIDAGLQRFVAAQTEDVIAALQRYHVTDGAALVADNRTGEVLAYVGSPDYFDDESLGRNDGVQALRQPESSLKPFTYELALERGTIAPTTILADVPAAYALPGGRLYEPADYSGRFSGPVRVRYALANSLNAPAVQVLSQLGVEPLLDRLHELGFTHLDRPAAYYGLGLTLGSGEVSLWELVQAYATLARGGEFGLPLALVSAPGRGAEARRIGRIADWSTRYRHAGRLRARAKSFGVASVLQNAVSAAAVKTGTSSDFRDTWRDRIHARLHGRGAWVGNFDGNSDARHLRHARHGPLWNRIMLHLYEHNDGPAAVFGTCAASSAPRSARRPGTRPMHAVRASSRNGSRHATLRRSGGRSRIPQCGLPFRATATCSCATTQRARSDGVRNSSRYARRGHGDRCDGAWTAIRSRPMRAGRRFFRCGLERGASRQTMGRIAMRSSFAWFHRRATRGRDSPGARRTAKR